jgi:uncharacterized phiE125 gp8 family phage protein
MTFSRALQNYEERVIFVHKAYKYKRTSVRTNLPIDINDLKSHLRIDWTDDTENAYLNMIINAVVARAEEEARVCMINQQWTTYRDEFEGAFQLRRAPYVSLDSFQYLNESGVLTTVSPSIYQIVDESAYCILTPKIYCQWPSDISDAYQAITIKFTVGYGTDKTTVPADLKFALLEHAANYYANRGDSDVAGMNTSGFGEMAANTAIPRIAADIYYKYKRLTLDGAIVY